jgi:hypothetical protein
MLRKNVVLPKRKRRNAVADEEVVRLLEETRDLQKEHIASYKEAVKNQQEAIAFQKKVSPRGMIFMLFVIVAVIVAVLASLSPNH